MTPQDVAIRFALTDHRPDDPIAQHHAERRAHRRARRTATRRGRHHR